LSLSPLSCSRALNIELPVRTSAAKQIAEKIAVPSAAKAGTENRAFIAAVNRCATQKQKRNQEAGTNTKARAQVRRCRGIPPLRTKRGKDEAPTDQKAKTKKSSSALCKAAGKDQCLIAALKRCATPNQPPQIKHPRSTAPNQPPEINHPRSTTPNQAPEINRPKSTTRDQPTQIKHPKSSTRDQPPSQLASSMARTA
jgi:hypothetical protein